MKAILAILLCLTRCAENAGSWRSDNKVIFSEQDAAVMGNEREKYKECPTGKDQEYCHDKASGVYRLHPRPF
jgi:hypothetical protein